MSSTSTQTLLSTAVQLSIISLFSSTGSDPLAMFSIVTDAALPADSFIHLLHDRLSKPSPPLPKTLLRLPELEGNGGSDPHLRGRELEQSVLHIQSPTIPTTYIQSPPISSSSDSSAHSGGLGIKLPWIHLQIRNLAKEWSFEVGIVDQAGRAGVIRLSTFQLLVNLSLSLRLDDTRIYHLLFKSTPLKNYTISLSVLFEIFFSKTPHLKTGPNSPPLLLLPLLFPARSTHLLTPWSTINIYLPTILSYFTSPHLLSNSTEDAENANQGPSSSNARPMGRNRAALPGGTLAHVSYVRVYASCRLRRIWFSEGGPSQKVPWELELYAVD
ncbi:hypothetical protein BDN70DRAFT_848613 [Pholiota conissans]|uniref:CFA20 domain-containing protein n=1 Tax=Pholiota conissans TaxID=109636 RepID=A0A9P5ZEK1_9AGAR|nr:hypothetical protein BDN70DRAFT_848613 [Pholiota conissans]